MRRFMSLKAIAIITATAMAFAAPASAYDDEYEPEPDPGAEAVIGIFGEIVGGAIERKQQKKFERQCQRWYERCEDGNDYACDRYQYRCE